MVPVPAPCNWISASGQKGVFRDGSIRNVGATPNVRRGFASAPPATAGIAFKTLRRSIFIFASIFSFFLEDGIHPAIGSRLLHFAGVTWILLTHGTPSSANPWVA